MTSRPLAALLVIATWAGCAPRTTTTVWFPRSTAEIANPERGFVVDVDLIAGRDFGEVRALGYTLGYARLRLDAYRGEPLPAWWLDALTAGFAAVRDAGIKVIVRFVYNDTADGADAPRAQILAHLEQLTPVLTASADVIAVLDAGFIGAWGEWHSSTSGLDNPHDRSAILAALLEALPASRSVTVRSPSFKRDAFGGPLDATRAFDGSPASRVGHHNSCFLASDTDLGTYLGEIEPWKAFVAQEGRFTPIGGETCQPNPPRSDCPTALAELERLHWSFLNSMYHQQVLASWRTQGCHAEIARQLGYRLELTSATFDRRVAPGGVLHVAITLVNTGYAAMYNPRPLYLTLDDQAAATTIDPRRWEPGVPVTISARLRIPADVPAGHHLLGLWLPDADPRLRLPARVDHYSVRIANTTWAAPYNLVTDQLVIDPTAPGPVDPTATTLFVMP